MDPFHETQESCKFGIRCSRRKSVHRNDQVHPGDEDYLMSNSEKVPVGSPFDRCYPKSSMQHRQLVHTSTVVQPIAQKTTTFHAAEKIEFQEISDSSAKLEPLEVSSFYQLSTFKNVTSIAAIELGNNQTIKAKLIIKSDKHHFAKYNGHGIMLTLNLIDWSGEITMTAFGDCVDKVFEVVEVNRVYYFSNFFVKLSDSAIRVNRFQLICTENTKILPDLCKIDVFPVLTFNFEPLKNIDLKFKNRTIDIIAICEHYEMMEPVTLGNKMPGKKREIFLVDQTGKITLTIWGSNAENFNSHIPCVIAVKRARISYWKGRSLDSSCLSSSTFNINPDIVEAHLLRDWYETKMIESEG